MPEWLSKKDNYIPLKDGDAFIDKSILSFLEVISKLILKSEGKRNIIEINAVVKVISTLMLVILLSTSRSLLFIITVNILLLLIVSLLSSDEIISILSASFIMSIFTFIILIPSIAKGNTGNSILIILKVLATITSVSVLSHVTKWNDITSALKIFFIPDLFILVLDITIKYIVVLGEFSLNMMYALKLRSIGKNKNKYYHLSGIMGTMFIKSKEMSEEMYNAMECRGFTGEYKAYKKFKFNFKDYIVILADVIIVNMYIFFR